MLKILLDKIDKAFFFFISEQKGYFQKLTFFPKDKISPDVSAVPFVTWSKKHWKRETNL